MDRLEFPVVYSQPLPRCKRWWCWSSDVRAVKFVCDDDFVVVYKCQKCGTVNADIVRIDDATEEPNGPS